MSCGSLIPARPPVWEEGLDDCLLVLGTSSDSETKTGALQHQCDREWIFRRRSDLPASETLARQRPPASMDWFGTGLCRSTLESHPWLPAYAVAHHSSENCLCRPSRRKSGRPAGRNHRSLKSNGVATFNGKLDILSNEDYTLSQSLRLAKTGMKTGFDVWIPANRWA